MALSSRFATSRASSIRSPRIVLGRMTASTRRSCRSISADLSASAAVTTSSRWTGSPSSRADSLPASVSSDSSSSPRCRLTASSCSKLARYDSTVAPASMSDSSRRACSTVSGVRSSWAALATNRFCPSRATSSRPSSPSMVSARSLNSSRGPVSASRSYTLRPEIRCSEPVIVRIGRSIRPAINQPKPSDSGVMSSSATPGTMSTSSGKASRPGSGSMRTSSRPGAGAGGAGGATGMPGSAITRSEGRVLARLATRISSTAPEMRVTRLYSSVSRHRNRFVGRIALRSGSRRGPRSR